MRLDGVIWWQDRGQQMADKGVAVTGKSSRLTGCCVTGNLGKKD